MANKRIDMTIGEYKRYNAQPVLLAVEKWIRILEARKRYYAYSAYMQRHYGRVSIDECFDELSIFDWWVKDLSLTRLKQMRTFLKEAIKLGYTGYVCFKVGVEGCANGMWANKLPTTNGYSPKCDFLYRSFTTNYTCWDAYENGESLTKRLGKDWGDIKTAKALEEALKEVA